MSSANNKIADLLFSLKMLLLLQRLNDSNARGKIVDYRVKGHNLKTGRTFAYDVNANVSHYSVPCCGSCEVTVFVRNSKGLSPPATLPSLHKTGRICFPVLPSCLYHILYFFIISLCSVKWLPHSDNCACLRMEIKYSYVHCFSAEPPQDVHVTVDNHSVIISWRKPVTAFAPTEYLVEWHPEDRRVEELQWVRLGRNENQAVITGTPRGVTACTLASDRCTKKHYPYKGVIIRLLTGL